jgi:hypothetical protein
VKEDKRGNDFNGKDFMTLLGALILKKQIFVGFV